MTPAGETQRAQRNHGYSLFTFPLSEGKKAIITINRNQPQHEILQITLFLDLNGLLLRLRIRRLQPKIRDFDGTPWHEFH